MAMTLNPPDPMIAQYMAQHPMHAVVAPLGPPPKPLSMADMAGMGDQAMPTMSTQAPRVRGMTPLEQYQDSEGKRMTADLGKDANPYGSPTNHPGVLGKFLHGLSVATGGPNRRQFEEENLGKQLQNTEDEKSKTGLEAAQAANQQSEADERGKPKPTQPKYQIEQTIDANGNPIYAAINESDPTDVHPIPSLRVPPKEEKPVAPKGSEHVSIMDDQGNKVEANYHPDTGTYTDTAGNIIKNPRPIPPPPSYGQLMLPTKTATFIDPNTGLPTEQQWDPKTGTYDRPLGLSASNAYGHEAAQAGAVDRAGTDLIQQLRDPSNREILGKLDSYIKQGTLGSPLADAQAARLSAELKTFAALQPAMHGFRSRSAQEAFERIVGGLAQNPDATIGSIQGILSTAGAINPGLQGGGSQPIVQQSPSTGQFRYSTDGGKTWQAGKPKGQ